MKFTGAKPLVAQMRRRARFMPKPIYGGLSKEDATLLAALEAERDPPLTEREWRREEGLARRRYARKGSSATR